MKWRWEKTEYKVLEVVFRDNEMLNVFALLQFGGFMERKKKGLSVRVSV